MKKIVFLCFILLNSLALCSKPAMKFNVSNEKITKCGFKRYSKLKNIILCHGSDPYLMKFTKIVFDDLSFTDQFDVDVRKTTKLLKDHSLKKLFEKGTSLVTFIKQIDDKKNPGLQVVIKDTNSDLTVFEKQVSLDKNNLVMNAHRLSSDILVSLTGDKGICLDSLVYCKAVAPSHKVICLSDIACLKTKVIVGSKTINLAPRWHSRVPVLFYSQLTKSNNRLMSVDLRTMRHKVVCSYDGLNMQPAFSDDGSRSVLCFSGGRGNSELYLFDKRFCKVSGKRLFKRLTNNGAHNVCPSLLSNGDIVFCSDYRTGSPQIYYFDIRSKQMYMLTNGRGYAAAPDYCKKTNTVAYVRPIRGTFQLFTICLDDFERIKERQVTFCYGSKHEPCWSDDGRYLTFSLDVPNKRGINVPQVAVLNYKSGKIRVLTKGPERKSFPRWTSRTFF